MYLVEEILSLGSHLEPQQYALKKVSCVHSTRPRRPPHSCYSRPIQVARESQSAPCQVLTSTGEHEELARGEIGIMQSLKHPNLLPLLASEHKQIEDVESGVSAFYMLFPLYPVQYRQPYNFHPHHAARMKLFCGILVISCLFA